MRTSLLPGLIDTLRTNVKRKMPRVRIFEVGRVFARANSHYEQPLRVGGLAFGPALPEQWGEPVRDVDFFDVKGDLEALAAPRRVATDPFAHPALHPGRSARVSIDGKVAGWMGELHPRLLRLFETCPRLRSCSRSTLRPSRTVRFRPGNRYRDFPSCGAISPSSWTKKCPRRRCSTPWNAPSHPM